MTGASDEHEHSISPAPTRRSMLQGAAFGSATGVLSGALLSAGLLGTARPAQAAETDPFPGRPRWRFVFVNHVTTNPFFVPTQYGIEDACLLLGCDHQWTGSANSDVAEMVNAMNAAIAAKASAIAVPIIDPKAFNAPTERALAFRCSPTTPTRPPAAPTSGWPISGRTCSRPAR